MNVLNSTSWGDIFVEERKKQYFIDLQKWLYIERRREKVFPPEEVVFDAFKFCEFTEVKVIVLGQDPYHGLGQAHGLSFSVNEGIALPKSLRNIYKELQDDLGLPAPITGNLTTWAKQGVLLLNAVLTVREAQPGSHRNKGWEIFTDHVISSLSDQKEHVVFVLWGNYARSKKSLIDVSRHFVIESVHPSPLSAYRGFFGSKPFSKINSYLKARGLQQINW